MSITGPIAYIFVFTVFPLLLSILYVGFVPAGFLSLPPDMVSAFVFMFGIAKAFEYFVPITTFLTCYGIILTVDFVILMWKLFSWIVSIITGAGC